MQKQTRQEALKRKQKAELYRKELQKRRIKATMILAGGLFAFLTLLIFIITQISGCVQRQNGKKSINLSLPAVVETSTETDSLLEEVSKLKEEESDTLETNVAENSSDASERVNEVSGQAQIFTESEPAFETAPVFEATFVEVEDAVLNQANREAAMYNYNAASAAIQAVDGYEENPAYVEALARYEQEKSALVQWADNTQITHIFFHSLIVDTSKAFDGDSKEAGYNESMTTVSEFVKIIQKLYDDGYVLVRLHDIAQMEDQGDGTQAMVMQPIYLPPGKKPIVLSVDDICYYEYMTGDGFANRLVIGEDGWVTNEYTMDDGSVVRGSYDVLPILEDFVKAHPDFSYRGAKGILAVTGYNGVFGYRTCDYWYREDCEYYVDSESNQKERLLYTTPNVNIWLDKDKVAEIAEAVKKQGWEIASHSWGHIHIASESYERVKSDSDLWETEVEPLVGETDIIIFAFGEDLGTYRGYEADDPKYQYLKEKGFNYFCNVDGSQQYWVQIGENKDYFRMGRRNLDGIRMWESIMSHVDASYTDRLLDLFDAREIFDPNRPTPVK